MWETRQRSFNFWTFRKGLNEFIFHSGFRMDSRPREWIWDPVNEFESPWMKSTFLGLLQCKISFQMIKGSFEMIKTSSKWSRSLRDDQLYVIKANSCDQEAWSWSIYMIKLPQSDQGTWSRSSHVLHVRVEPSAWLEIVDQEAMGPLFWYLLWFKPYKE